MLEKVKGIDRRNVLYAFVFSTLILFDTYKSIFCLLAFAVGVYVVLHYEEVFVLEIFLLILPMSTIFKMNPGGTSFLTYLEFFFVAVHIGRNKCKISKLEMSVILFGCYLLVMEIIHGGIALTTTMKIITYLFILIAATKVDVENRYKHMFLMYISGIIISSIIIRLNIPIFKVSNFVVNKTDVIVGTSYTRMAGLYGDPNYYSIHLIIALCLVIIMYARKEMGRISAILISTIMVFFVIQTMSKSAFLMLSIPAIFMIYIFFKQKKYVWAIISVGVIGVAGIMAFSGRIAAVENIMLRFSNTSGDITSGRLTIWAGYIEYLGNHIGDTLFGRSMLYYTLDGMVAHNTYIDIVYELGVIGGIFLLTIIAKTLNSSFEKIKRNLLNYSVLITVIIMYGFLSELQYFDPPFHLVLALICANLDMSVFNVPCE